VQAGISADRRRFCPRTTCGHARGDEPLLGSPTTAGFADGLGWPARSRSTAWRRVLRVEEAYGLEIPQSLEEACDPARLALIVYDMQVGILQQLRNGAQLVARVVEILDAARAAGVRVVFMRHMSLPNELAGVFQLRMAMSWQKVARAEDVRPWFLRDSPGFQLVPELSPRATEAIFDKITMSAFEGTPLPIVLRDCGLRAFAIVGVATEIGIEPTVRHGADLGFIPIVVSDACGAGDEAAGERALSSIRFIGDAFVTDSETLRSVLRRGLGRSSPSR
jgi:nicotinamidase-related amidase